MYKWVIHQKRALSSLILIISLLECYVMYCPCTNLILVVNNMIICKLLFIHFNNHFISIYSQNRSQDSNFIYKFATYKINETLTLYSLWPTKCKMLLWPKAHLRGNVYILVIIMYAIQVCYFQVCVRNHI